MFFIDILARLFSILSSAATPKQIGGGFALGMVAGLNPSFPITIFVIILILLFNVNLTAALFSIAFFGLFAFVIDPVFHNLGFFALAQIQPLQPVWTWLYNLPFVPLTNFNNTVVMGALVLSVLFLFPVYQLTKRGTILYRAKYQEKLKNWKVMRFVRGTQIYKWYQNLKRIGDRLW